MARFSGKVGYGIAVETGPGVWEDQITERNYFGDVLRDTRSLTNEDKVNNDILVRNSISIVADAYANENFHAIRYVEWMGKRWRVTDVEVRRPRLLLSLGEVWNGPTS
jgi:hypothetical protein